MSLRQSFNKVFAEKISDRGVCKKIYQGAKDKVLGSGIYERLEAEVYWEVLRPSLENTPFLVAFEIVLQPGCVATSAQLDATNREEKLSGAESADEVMSLANRLVALATYKELPPSNPRARFIAGIIEAFYIVERANDHDKINYWLRIKDILISVGSSTLANSWAMADQIREFLGLQETLAHYQTELALAVSMVEQIIAKEKVIQAKQEVRDELNKLNCSMNRIPRLLRRFIYALYSEKPPKDSLDFHYLYLNNSPHMTSLLTVGVQQILGLPNPPTEECYTNSKLNDLGIKIQTLNSIIKTVGGTRLLEIGDRVFPAPNLENSVVFLQNLLNMIKHDVLILDGKGMIIIFEFDIDDKSNRTLRLVNGKKKVLHTFPSGFSQEMYFFAKNSVPEEEAHRLRQEKVESYIELLVLIQELQHGILINDNYSSFLDQAGAIAAFRMVTVEMHKHMEAHNIQTAQSLENKLDVLFNRFKKEIFLKRTAKYFANKRSGKIRRTVLSGAEKAFATIQSCTKAIAGHATAVQVKRMAAVKKMEDNKVSYYKSLQGLIDSFNTFRHLQNLLGREVPELTPESVAAMVGVAKQFDGIVRQQFPAPNDDSKEEHLVITNPYSPLGPQLSSSIERNQSLKVRGESTPSGQKLDEREKLQLQARVVASNDNRGELESSGGEETSGDLSEDMGAASDSSDSSQSSNSSLDNTTRMRDKENSSPFPTTPPLKTRVVAEISNQVDTERDEGKEKDVDIRVADNANKPLLNQHIAITQDEDSATKELGPLPLISKVSENPSLLVSSAAAEISLPGYSASNDKVKGVTETVESVEEKRPLPISPFIYSLERISMWRYEKKENASENEWHYSDPSKFNLARQILGYDIEKKPDLDGEIIEEKKYDPANLLSPYLPKTVPARNEEEKEFDYHIRLRCHIADALKNNMISPFKTFFSKRDRSTSTSEHRNHGRAARLVLCEEMFRIFEATLHNELLSEEEIKRRCALLTKVFKAQKEMLPGTFNRKLKNMQDALAAGVKQAIKDNTGLQQINEKIDAQFGESLGSEEELHLIHCYVCDVNNKNEYEDRVLKRITIQKLQYYEKINLLAKQLEKVIQEDEWDSASVGERLLPLEKQLMKLEQDFQSVAQKEKFLPWLKNLKEKIHTFQEKLGKEAAVNLEREEREKEAETTRVTKQAINELKAFVGREEKTLSSSDKNFERVVEEIQAISDDDMYYVSSTEGILLKAASTILDDSPHRIAIDNIAAHLRIQIPEEKFKPAVGDSGVAKAIVLLAEKYIRMRAGQTSLTMTEENPELGEFAPALDIPPVEPRVRAMIRLKEAALAYQQDCSENKRNVIFDEAEKLSGLILAMVKDEERLNRKETKDLILRLLVVLSLIESISPQEEGRSHRCVRLRQKLLEISSFSDIALQEVKDRKAKVFEKVKEEIRAQEKLLLLNCVRSNLSMLEKGHVSSANNAAVPHLTQIRVILSKSKKTDDSYLADIKQQLILAAKKVIFRADAGESLMLRMAINNIAKEVGYTIAPEEFALAVPQHSEKLNTSSVSSSSNVEAVACPLAAPTPKQTAAGAIGYEIKGLVLSNLRKGFNFSTIFGEHYTPDTFFNEVLKPMGIAVTTTVALSSERSSVVSEMIYRMETLLKATVSVDNHDSSEMRNKVVDILELLCIYTYAEQYRQGDFSKTDALISLIEKRFKEKEEKDKQREDHTMSEYDEIFHVISLLCQDLTHDESSQRSRLDAFYRLVPLFNPGILRRKKAAERYAFLLDQQTPQSASSKEGVWVSAQESSSQEFELKEGEKIDIVEKAVSALKLSIEKTPVIQLLGLDINEILPIIERERRQPGSSTDYIIKETISLIKTKLENSQPDGNSRPPYLDDKQARHYAYQLVALAHISSAAEVYRGDPNPNTQEDLLLTLESVINAVESDYLGENFGAIAEYSETLKSIVETLKSSPFPREVDEIERLCDRLNAFEADERHRKEVISNLEMLKAGAITSSFEHEKIIKASLLRLEEIVAKEALSAANKKAVITTLVEVANHLPRIGPFGEEGASLTLRIAINNIAIAMGQGAIGKEEFGKLVGQKKALSHTAAASPPPIIIEGIRYDIKRFVLSKFSCDINGEICIAGLDLKADEFFNGVLEPMYSKVSYDRENSYGPIKTRIIAMLKATSMREQADSTIGCEVDQIIDLLHLNHIGRLKGWKNLQDFSSSNLFSSPFNTTIQHLKGYIRKYPKHSQTSADVLEAKELETEKVLPVYASTKKSNRAKEIQDKVRLFIESNFNNEKNTLKEIHAILAAEDKKSFSLLKLQEFPLQLEGLVRIYMAAEAYQHDPCAYTQNNLSYVVEIAINLANDAEKEGVPAGPECLALLKVKPVIKAADDGTKKGRRREGSEYFELLKTLGVCSSAISGDAGLLKDSMGKLLQRLNQPRTLSRALTSTTQTRATVTRSQFFQPSGRKTDPAVATENIIYIECAARQGIRLQFGDNFSPEIFDTILQIVKANPSNRSKAEFEIKRLIDNQWSFFKPGIFSPAGDKAETRAARIVLLVNIYNMAKSCSDFQTSPAATQTNLSRELTTVAPLIKQSLESEYRACAKELAYLRSVGTISSLLIETSEEIEKKELLSMNVAIEKRAEKGGFVSEAVDCLKSNPQAQAYVKERIDSVNASPSSQTSSFNHHAAAPI